MGKKSERQPYDRSSKWLIEHQVFTRLRYNKTDLLGSLLRILGGSRDMLDLPFLDELLAEKLQVTVEKTRQEDILANLEVRFGNISAAVAEQVRLITDVDRLKELHARSAVCPDNESFGRELDQ